MSYVRQVICVRKDLSMPTGKLAAMVAHASMSFIIKNMDDCWIGEEQPFQLNLTEVQHQWLTELDPGLEPHHQVSMAKIVLAVNSEKELLDVESKAKEAKLTVHRVIDSGHSHNPPGTFVCIAIGPDFPDKIDSVTKHLKVYR